jgi:hypothetical protein
MKFSSLRRVLREVLVVAGGGAFVAALIASSSWIGVYRVGSSSLLVDMTIEQMAHSATAVAVGVITAQRTRPAVEGIGVFTDWTLEVSETLKGPRTSTLNVTTRGGRFANIVAIAEDEPALEIGQRVLVFVAPRWDGSNEVIGGYQGRFVIRGDEATNERSRLPLDHLRDRVQRSR